MPQCRRQCINKYLRIGFFLGSSAPAFNRLPPIRLAATRFDEEAWATESAPEYRPVSECSPSSLSQLSVDGDDACARRRMDRQALEDKSSGPAITIGDCGQTPLSGVLGGVLLLAQIYACAGLKCPVQRQNMDPRDKGPISTVCGIKSPAGYGSGTEPGTWKEN